MLHRDLERAKYAVQQTLEVTLASRDQKISAGLQLKDVMLRAMDDQMPDRVLEVARVVIRPLYGMRPNGVGMIDQAPVLWENRREILKEKTSHVFEKEYSIEHARMSKRGAALPTNVEGALSLH